MPVGKTKTKRSVNLTKLLKNYVDSGLYLALAKNYKKVVGTGKTMREAVNDAKRKGYNNPIILRAPTRDALTGHHCHY